MAAVNRSRPRVHPDQPDTRQPGPKPITGLEAYQNLAAVWSGPFAVSAVIRDQAVIVKPVAGLLVDGIASRITSMERV